MLGTMAFLILFGYIVHVFFLTAPPPEIPIASVTLSKTTCHQRSWTADLQENCSSGNYALYLTWAKPFTFYPIQEYLIRWGRWVPWVFGAFWVHKGKEFGVSTSMVSVVTCYFSLSRKWMLFSSRPFS